MFAKLLSAGVAALIVSGGVAAPSGAGPLNQWDVSCSVDPGAITRKGDVRTFRTSTNRCPGGIFAQRAEISTDKIRPNHRGNYLFRSRISVRTGSGERFGIFQIHDGRHGCAPPLKVDVERNGAVSLDSDIKTGPGESCIRGAIDETSVPGVIRRDGTAHDLQVLVEFDGTGSFAATVWVDNVARVAGRYRIETGRHRPKFYYFKHGVYSQHMFDYVMTSRGMEVTRVKVRR